MRVELHSPDDWTVGAAAFGERFIGPRTHRVDLMIDRFEYDSSPLELFTNWHDTAFLEEKEVARASQGQQSRIQH